MSFLVPTDFDDVPYTLASNGNASFPNYIQEQEDDILLKLLGFSFLDELKKQLLLLPAEWVADNTPGYVDDDVVVYGVSVWKSLIIDNLNNVPAENANWTKVEDNVWLQFVKGNSYMFNDKTYVWRGLKKLLKPYVYSKWISDTTFNNSKLGMTIAKIENADVINPSWNIRKGFNDFSRLAGNCYDPYNTLYGYLYQTGPTSVFDSTFDSTMYSSFLDYFQHVFTAPGTMNEFDI